MKVMALNSSPRGGGQSKTELLLRHLVKGMTEAGADVEVVELRKKKINYCSGCFTCWSKTPGVCIHQDDMTRDLYPRYVEADLAVLASPLYHFTFNAQMKTFIERTLPVIEPFIHHREDGSSYHPLRGRHPGVIVLSVAGFHEKSVFDQLSAYARFLYGPGLLAEIYRPGAESLSASFFEDQRKEILEAVEAAGRELAKTARVSPETLEKITQPLRNEEVLSDLANCMWRTCISEKITPKEMVEKGIMPRADSLESFMAMMRLAFRGEKAGDVEATLEFRFSGDLEGTCHFIMKNGQIQARSGPASAPDLAIVSPFETWLDIMTGRADGQQLFLEGKYSTEGDANLLMRLGDFFGA